MKRILCILLAFLLCLPMTALATSFPDVQSGASYAEAVDYLDTIGIMSGDQNGRFNPDATVTRAEMATIVCRMLGEADDLPARNDFPDVPIGHWANGYVSKAVELGVVTGYDTGMFGPTDVVTYEQALTMLVRTLGYENEAHVAGGYPDGYLSIAQSLGLLDEIHAAKGELLARKIVAVIIYNCYNSYV